MYRVWDVTFQLQPSRQGPCDPFQVTEPLVLGSVGDADPFSDAFGKALINVEDSFRACSTSYQQALSVTSDIPDIFTVQSPSQESPYTPHTAQSTFSQSDRRSSMSTHVCYLPTSPGVDVYMGMIDSSIRPPRSPDLLSACKKVVAELPVEHEYCSDVSFPQLSPSTITEVAQVAISQGKPFSSSKGKPKTSGKKRGKKAVSLTTQRPSAKTREQHLSDNKAAAAKCRLQRKAWETHLADASVILRTTINASQSAITELRNEVAALKRQMWECPNCTERYVHSGEPHSHGIPLEVLADDNVLTRTSPLSI